MSTKKVIAEITIDGQTLSYDHLNLKQSYDTHHIFRISIDTKPRKGLLLQKAKDYIGKFVRIELKETDFSLSVPQLTKTNLFLGMVTGLSLERRGRSGDTLLIVGEGLSKLMDEGDHVASFCDKGLKEIINSIFDQYTGSAIKECQAAAVDPAYTDAIPYLVQYKESNYEFFCRLGNKFGAWFFYNGDQFVFGKLPEGEETTLFLNNNLNDFNLSAKIQAIDFNLKGYDYVNQKFPEAPAAFSGAMSKLTKLAYDASKEEAYKGTVKTQFPVTPSLEEKQLKYLAQKRTANAVNEMVILGGSSLESKLRIGNKIAIKDNTLEDGEDYGKFIITAIEHEISETGENYVNTFEAVPEELEFPPLNEFVIEPHCEAQAASVFKLDDDKKLGRVKVKFNWQKEKDEKMPWIKVISSSTGGKKGAAFTPEIDDFVWVEFEQDNPDFPYVTGGFYHGAAKPEFFDPENKSKAIKTRSGNLIFFSDDGGKETVKISNPDGKNEIILTLDGSPTITIKSDKTVNISAGSSVSISADSSISLSSASIVIDGSEKVEINSPSITATAADGTISMNSKDINVNSDSSATIDSQGSVTVKSVSDTNVSGKTINLNS
ncbi:type VI secretion system Vgr family protein [Flavilitoribacter nigricans]|uniref:Gp5/Type VI secretion system Vgr protein OB-fold domain-containing protein n=1 Tax=Flavilitoribacter nigricans (strain ATCC 23147 / DSM 23189 / NBRC 102662 / NCIMB 1420 / SS-2) TaxID=1122177 RepID=A0A2D0N9E7_FLAN2|nr:phage baseplate assembly protein V [Flavilitoribacter nigricans]PHN05107.1 hypothetical protein CRP01_18980 [Flavilitoribacter nigricans DSM 23189 = NBRC 102662]